MLKCSQCGGDTESIIDGVVLCVFCEDGEVNPTAKRGAIAQPVFEPRRKEMADRVCGGYGSRAGACTQVLGELNRTGLCPKCYQRKKYAENHPGRKERALKVAAPKGFDSLPQLPVEHLISLQLRESQVQKLLQILL